MKNKNGFTLIEILAVIAILCILVTIATFSVMKTKENSMKKLLNIKIGELEASGILYGQENQEELNLKCTIDNEKYEFCTKKTVKELIDSDYYKSNEVNSSGQKDLLNNVTNESMLNDIVMIYKKNNRVYAKYIDSETEFGIETKPNPEPNPEPEPEVSCSNIKDVCKSGDNLANCIISFSQKCKLDVPEIYHHDSSLINGAGDNSYRYAGANPNNFVCFGSTTSPCPTDNLYRIIGVFEDNYHGVSGKQLVKLIKYDYMTTDELGTDGDYGESSTPDSTYKGSLTSIDAYYWNNATVTNTWSESNLNKINLNTNFINNIGNTWANKIATTTWKDGGNTWNNIVESVPSIAYQNEIVAPAENTTYEAKIGLMYASDYGFAASPSAWTMTLSYTESDNGYDSNAVRSVNWMYMGYVEWTITPHASAIIYAFYLSNYGNLSGNFEKNGAGSRPVLYLDASVYKIDGDGSLNNPYIVGM